MPIAGLFRIVGGSRAHRRARMFRARGGGKIHFHVAQRPRRGIRLAEVKRVTRAAPFEHGFQFGRDIRRLPDRAARLIRNAANIRNLNEAILYPALAMLESSKNYSVGRGTDTPFELVGAEWINGPALAEHLGSRDIPGVRVHPVEFTPTSSNLSGKKVSGIGFEITDRNAFSATKLGIELAEALGKLYPGKIPWEDSRRLLGSEAVVRLLAQGESAETAASEGVERFVAMRSKYLLYR